jgi:hypothetical protein
MWDIMFYHPKNEKIEKITDTNRGAGSLQAKELPELTLTFMQLKFFLRNFFKLANFGVRPMQQ